MSNRLIIRELSSPIGPLTLTTTERGLFSLDFGAISDVEGALRTWAGRRLGAGVAFDRDSGQLDAALAKLQRYFAGERVIFDIPLDLHGTDFQRKVWAALRDIPYGETRSYGDIARTIGQVKAVRAVGGANHRNPLPIIVPCHRVIGANGDLVGYGGGLDLKIRLLQLEGIKPI